MTTTFAQAIKARFPDLWPVDKLPPTIEYPDSAGQTIAKPIDLATVEEILSARAALSADVLAKSIALQAMTALEGELRKTGASGSTPISTIVTEG